MSKLSDLDWDLIRVFLAVTRSKSLRQAALSLGASHPTVRRRLKLLENQLGVRLFDRTSDSLQPTTEALALIEKAEAVEASIHAFERSADCADHKLEGEIHITAPDLIMSELLAPDLAAFCKRWPQIDLHVETTYELANLSNREADIAFRIVGRESLPHPNLAGRKAATIHGAVYGEGEHWLGWQEEEQQREIIGKSSFAHLPIRGVMNNVYLQRAVCMQGMGIALLPCFMADPFLRRRSEPEAIADLWILVHPDLQQNPRLRLFRDEMVKALGNYAAKLEGCGDRFQP